jgi:hypothetical protein
VKKLYVVVRGDLPPGAQGSQTGHAVATFARRARSAFEQWYDNSNNFIWLSIDDEPRLEALAVALERTGRPVRVFEPDLGNQLTAIAFEGTDDAMKLVSSLPLALRPSRTLAVA